MQVLSGISEAEMEPLGPAADDVINSSHAAHGKKIMVSSSLNLHFLTPRLIFFPHPEGNQVYLWTQPHPHKPEPIIFL